MLIFQRKVVIIIEYNFVSNIVRTKKKKERSFHLLIYFNAKSNKKS